MASMTCTGGSSIGRPSLRRSGPAQRSCLPKRLNPSPDSWS